MKSFFIIGTVLLFSSLADAAIPEICSRLEHVIQTGTPKQKLNHFFKMQWDHEMKELPESATYLGYPGQNDRWNDRSLAVIDRQKQEDICELKVLQKISRKTLKGEERISYDLAIRRLVIAIEGQKFGGEYLVMDHLNGLQMEVPDILDAMPAANKKDYVDMLARLDKVPQLADQTEILLREGLKKHIVPVKMFMARVPDQFDRVLTARIEDSPLYRPFAHVDLNLSIADRIELQKQAKQIIESKVYPALRRLKEFVVKTYIPGCRESISWSDMPNGKEWYAYNVKTQTTTSMTPEELHQLGLREVARITQEMEKAKSDARFNGDLAAFNKYLMSDKKFFYTDKEQMLSGFRDIAKRIDAQLPTLFKTLPRLPYGVREMPLYKSAEAPAAYYEGGSLTAGRGANIDINTTDLSGRPKWGMEALTLHEGAPGHHVQISLAQEMDKLPDFRKNEYFTAFGEGWGLYAESVGEELGLMKDPYSKYGQLSYEMWRAIRLVVDTGIHSKGWTRDQALEYFAAHMPKSKKERENEVDRYITWPGQALAYKVGQLKFRELREEAKLRLGDKFDVREFHDQLLKHGSLPLDVLEKTVHEWLQSEKPSRMAGP